MIDGGATGQSVVVGKAARNLLHITLVVSLMNLTKIRYADQVILACRDDNDSRQMQASSGLVGHYTRTLNSSPNSMNSFIQRLAASSSLARSRTADKVFWVRLK